MQKKLGEKHRSYLQSLAFNPLYHFRCRGAHRQPALQQLRRSPMFFCGCKEKGRITPLR